MKKIQTCNKGTKHLAFIPLTVWQGARNAEHVTETEFEGVFSVTNYPPLTSHIFSDLVLSSCTVVEFYLQFLYLPLLLPTFEGRGCIKAGTRWSGERRGMEETPKALAQRGYIRYAVLFCHCFPGTFRPPPRSTLPVNLLFPLTQLLSPTGDTFHASFFSIPPAPSTIPRFRRFLLPLIYYFVV